MFMCIMCINAVWKLGRNQNVKTKSNIDIYDDDFRPILTNINSYLEDRHMGRKIEQEVEDREVLINKPI